MKKLLLMSAVLGVMLVSFSASAILVGARGFTMCTSIDGSLNCTGGSTYWGIGTSPAIQEDTGATCDWGGDCEVWRPDGEDSITGVLGVNWTCCINLESGETNLVYGMHFYDVERGDWSYDLGIPPDWKGYIGTGTCDEGTAVYQGKDGFADDGSPPWSYGASDRVARCVGRASVTGGFHEKAIEYWMDE